MTFKWNQTGGVEVQLSSTDKINSTFTAPTVTAVTALTFTLEVSNADGKTTDDVIINVSPGIADAVSRNVSKRNDTTTDYLSRSPSKALT